MIGIPQECVIDASVAAKLFLPEEDADKAQALIAAVSADEAAILHVPDLFFAECANVLWKSVTRLGYPLEKARANLVSLQEMELTIAPTAGLADIALTAACRLGLTAYDACYVALADARGIPLITADDRLASKLAGTSHQVITLSSL